MNDWFEENLCGTRGLEAGSELQTYIINLSKTFLDQFNAALKISDENTMQFDEHTTHFDATTANIQKIAKVSFEMELRQEIL